MSQLKRYIYEIPYLDLQLLCEILEMDSAWKTLAGHMNYDVQTINSIQRKQSPAEVLLKKWSTENHTVNELFRLLFKMQHLWAMTAIVKFVSPELRSLLRTNDETPVSNRVECNVNINTKQSKEHPPHKASNLDANVCTLAGPIEIPYSQLEECTSGWNELNLLGRGGFGMVFKGVWLETKVAIKRIKKQGSIHNQSLFTELSSLSSMVHENILPLYGFSRDGEYGCLVYQFMEGGTVEDRLQLRGPASESSPLSWPERRAIATGVARGLNFLHRAREKPLVHGDIKSANILLDSRMVPRIGDFGLTRLGPSRDVTSVRVSQVHGTKPYLPDELLRSGKLSPKVDTYSFGVVLMELATGQRAWNPRAKQQLLRDAVLSKMESDETVAELADPRAPGHPFPTARHLLTIARICCAEIAKNRPEMKDVLIRLEQDCDQTRQCATCSTRLVDGSHHPSCSPDTRSPSPRAVTRTPSPAHPVSPVLHPPSPPMQNSLMPPVLQLSPRQTSPARSIEVQSNRARQESPIPTKSTGDEAEQQNQTPVIQETECRCSTTAELSSSLTSVSLEGDSSANVNNVIQETHVPWVPEPRAPGDPFSLPLVSIIHGREPDPQPTGAS